MIFGAGTTSQHVLKDAENAVDIGPSFRSDPVGDTLSEQAVQMIKTLVEEPLWKSRPRDSGST
jgi:hypothetical protein